jgi:heavy metal translocating P-type ATPase
MVPKTPVFSRALLFLTVAGISVGGTLWLLGLPLPAGRVWAASTLLALIPLAASVLSSLFKKEVGVDVIALLAMAGALALGEYLTGSVIALMLTGGQFLEAYADSRARREISSLVERAPRVVHRYEEGVLTSPGIADVRPGDRLLVKPGEVIPVDGVVEEGEAVLDESTLTGEARPIQRRRGEKVLSGSVSAGGPFDLRATATAEASTYAAIVHLVREALAQKAPFVRLADRYSLLFLPLTLVMAGIAWAISGDPVRALSVLVVATPCPLILAAPVAIVSGISRAARHGIIVKGGGALETLARGRVVLLDKTGTVTRGKPQLSDVLAFDGSDSTELLRLAASLDQVSTHILAAAIVRGAHDRGLKLSFPSGVTEKPGTGIRGVVDGHEVAVGSARWVSEGRKLPAEVRKVRRRTSLEGALSAFLSVDGSVKGALVLEDPIRPESPRTIRALKRAGIKKVILLTGDHPDVAEIVGAAVGVDEVLAERSPAEKVEAVTAESARAITIMVGDGVNDAPALAAAHVGVALGARGATASSEAADVVLMVDRLERLEEALYTARRSRNIALESVLAGMGLSLGAMSFAMAGLVPPVAGALIQEVIDVAVILNALRALRDGGARKIRDEAASRDRDRAREAHQELFPKVGRLRQVADRLDSFTPEEARRELEEVRRFLVEELLPHEKHEDETVYRTVAKLMGGKDPTGTMSRAHLEIAHLIRLYVRLVEDLPQEGPGPEDLRDLRKSLYALDALLRLHFAQEEEDYFSLLDARLGAGK